MHPLLAPLPGRARLAPALLVGGALLVYGLVLGAQRYAGNPRPWGADAGAYCRIAESVVARGSLELPPPDRLPDDPQVRLDSAWGTPYALTARGRVLPKHSILYGLLLAPGVAAGGAFGAFAVALLLSAALAGVVTARMAARLGALPAAAAAFILFFLVPPARLVVLAINVDVALALVMVLAYAALADGRPAAGGALAAASLFLRPTAPLLFLPVPLLLGRSRAAWLRFGAGAAGPALLFAAMNTALWGAPWRTAYDRAFVLGAHGWTVERHTDLFGADPLRGLALLFLDPAGGLLARAPVMLLGLAGYALAAARRPEWIAATLGGALALVSLAPYAFLSVVPAFNARFALPLLVSLAPPLAALIAELLTRALRERERPPRP